MANLNYDVLRLEGLQGTTGVLVNMRNKMIGFETDGQHRMIHKNAAGAAEYWTPDGETGIDASSVDYSNGAYPAVEDVRAALDAVISSTTSDSGTLTVVNGMTGVGAGPKTVSYTYTLVDNVVTMEISTECINYGNSSDTVIRLTGWPTEAWPTAQDTYIPVSIRDDDLLITSYAGAGRLYIPALTGATGAETGIIVQILKVDGVSGYPEYSNTFGATGMKGFGRFVAQYPLDAIA